MKYLLALLFGLAVGIAAAVAALYFNPLTADAGRGRPAAAWELGYALSAPSASLLTHAQSLRLPVIPVDAPLLWEQGVRGTVLAALRLEDAAGAALAATRISVPSADTDLLMAGLLVDDYWLVTAPGRGTLYVHLVNNQWPLLKESVGRVDLLRRPWLGVANYDPTSGPAAGRGVVHGLSGEFAGRSGSAQELLSLERYDSQGFAGLSGQLLLTVDSAAR